MSTEPLPIRSATAIARRSTRPLPKSGCPGTGTRPSTARCSTWPAAWRGFVTTPSSSIPPRRHGPTFEDLLRRIHDIKTRNYQRLLAAGAIPLRADIGQLICDARTEGVRLAIASSSKLENVVGLLRANLGPNADTWFDAIASGNVPAAKKPSPELYLWTLKQLNLPARDCLAVEDSAHGLTAALAAGIPTVITVSDYTINENFDGARMVLPEADQVSLDKLRLWHATASTS
jgi:HAD superfamily hydrolase (TIGR01509 family)